MVELLHEDPFLQCPAALAKSPGDADSPGRVSRADPTVPAPDTLSSEPAIVHDESRAGDPTPSTNNSSPTGSGSAPVVPDLAVATSPADPKAVAPAPAPLQDGSDSALPEPRDASHSAVPATGARPPLEGPDCATTSARGSAKVANPTVESIEAAALVDGSSPSQLSFSAGPGQGSTVMLASGSSPPTEVSSSAVQGETLMVDQHATLDQHRTTSTAASELAGAQAAVAPMGSVTTATTEHEAEASQPGTSSPTADTALGLSTQVAQQPPVLPVSAELADPHSPGQQAAVSAKPAAPSAAADTAPLGWRCSSSDWRTPTAASWAQISTIACRAVRTLNWASEADLSGPNEEMMLPYYAGLRSNVVRLLHDLLLGHLDDFTLDFGDILQVGLVPVMRECTLLRGKSPMLCLLTTALAKRWLCDNVLQQGSLHPVGHSLPGPCSENHLQIRSVWALMGEPFSHACHKDKTACSSSLWSASS